ncbi:hypothetical protein ACOSQ3_027144 [Xanthoceras sorbifolium]
MGSLGHNETFSVRSFPIVFIAKLREFPCSVVQRCRRFWGKRSYKFLYSLFCVGNKQTGSNQIQMAYHIVQRFLFLKYSNQVEDSIRQALQNLKESYINGRL